MLDSVLLYHTLWVATRVEGTAEDLLELFVEATNAQLLKVEVLLKDLPLLDLVGEYLQGLADFLSRLAVDNGPHFNDTVGEVSEVSVKVLDLVHLDLHYDLTIMKLQRGDFSLVDEHPIEQGLNCLAYVLLMDLERALGVSWVVLIHIEDRYGELN